MINFTFFKLYKWHQIAERITIKNVTTSAINCSKEQIFHQLFLEYLKKKRYESRYLKKCNVTLVSSHKIFIQAKTFKTSNNVQRQLRHFFLNILQKYNQLLIFSNYVRPLLSNRIMPTCRTFDVYLHVKNHIHVKKVGHTSEFLFSIY